MNENDMLPDTPLDLLYEDEAALRDYSEKSAINATNDGGNAMTAKMDSKIPTIDEIMLKSTMTDYGIPDRFHGGLVRYIVSGLKPGSFLCSVLANDLLFAVCRADDDVTLDHLKALVRFLNSEVPMECHGSHKLVAEYMAAKAKEFGVTK